MPYILPLALPTVFALIQCHNVIYKRMLDVCRKSLASAAKRLYNFLKYFVILPLFKNSSRRSRAPVRNVTKLAEKPSDLSVNYGFCISY
jgi:hypothetical protein